MRSGMTLILTLEARFHLHVTSRFCASVALRPSEEDTQAPVQTQTPEQAQCHGGSPRLDHRAFSARQCHRPHAA